MSFRLGDSCCDFICIDDVMPSLPEGGDGDHRQRQSSLGVRLAAAILTALMAFVLLLFLVHRLRQRRITGGCRLLGYRLVGAGSILYLLMSSHQFQR